MTQRDHVKNCCTVSADLPDWWLRSVGGYACGLEFDRLPNEELLRSRVQETRERAGLSDSFTVEWLVFAQAPLVPCPVPNDCTFGLRSERIVCKPIFSPPYKSVSPVKI